MSYLDIALNNGTPVATKNSGLLVCTGSGSSSWNFTMNRISHEVVQRIFDISGYKNANVDEVVAKYNNSLRFTPGNDYTQVPCNMSNGISSELENIFFSTLN